MTDEHEALIRKLAAEEHEARRVIDWHRERPWPQDAEGRARAAQDEAVARHRLWWAEHALSRAIYSHPPTEAAGSDAGPRS